MKPAGRRDSVVTGARVRRGSRKSAPVVEVDDAPTEEAGAQADVTFVEEDDEEESQKYIKPSTAASKAFGALGLEDLFTVSSPSSDNHRVMRVMRHNAHSPHTKYSIFTALANEMAELMGPPRSMIRAIR